MSLYQKKVKPYSDTEICLICEKQKPLGIHLYHSFICLDCEMDIINTKTSDQKYQFYVRRLKQVQFNEKRRQA
ncbi:sigma factor G inhibitor Gin [Niallia sp. NCCP-28]|uniref:sigma factor G inhibitor Gin n=1 Tax=Niallia sp. NCCP-28 TaxID=2934712 RepID=UPI0020827D68|nr:sigma factor G inhibitor Gin [Niallia sp. NCCP-28]GKU85044.1 hypothetical protein NCCP28_44400 [Niallia sp. NCCP-28]